MFYWMDDSASMTAKPKGLTFWFYRWRSGSLGFWVVYRWKDQTAKAWQFRYSRKYRYFVFNKHQVTLETLAKVREWENMNGGEQKT